MPRFLFFSVLACGLAAGCGGEPVEDPDAGRDSAIVVRCSARDDVDMDRISTEDEGLGDADGDGLANFEDSDSDGDGFPDADEAGDSDCNTVPIDSDSDGTPDFLDTDANGDGTPDSEQAESDLDGDGIPDYLDRDVDGDGISNIIEWGDEPLGDGEPRDSDGDGTPDVLDLDSDGDTILDGQEGAVDIDFDGDPNYLDLDSDADSIPDSVEAGDGILSSPPHVCDREVDPITMEIRPDGRADFADVDSDNDGLGDGEELALGTDPCNVDTDGDGIGDLAEGAYERFNCPDGETGIDCGCATRSTCRIPDEHFYVILPYEGPPVERDLDFGTDIRVADVFFLTDSTGSMGGTLQRVQDTVASPTGLIARIGETIPDAWFGGGSFDDFPLSGYGGGSDEAFDLAIRMTPPERASDVEAAFNALIASGGGDGPESLTEAVFQTIEGDGGTWMHGGATYNMHAFEGDCLDTGWGAPCFREAALAIIVLFTDNCAHAGPPGDASGCRPYMGITPPPATWMEMIAAMNVRGAKFVGISARGGCSTSVAPASGDPCYFMQRTAEETGSVDLDSNALVYDLPSGGASDTVFVDTVVGAIETVATRVPLDLDTAVRDDPSDAAGIDAARFVKRRQPSCNAHPPAETCWTPPTGVPHEQAVAVVDESTFFGVIPGTRVQFRITFQNDFYPGGPTAEVYIAFIDVRTGTARLDTRQVIIVVPAAPDGGFG